MCGRGGGGGPAKKAPESESGKKTPRFHVPVSLLQEPHGHGAERSCPTQEGALPTSIQKVAATKGLSELLFTLSGSVCPRHYSPFHYSVAVWRLGYGLDTGRL